MSRLLLVEDDEMIAEPLRYQLEREGFQVVHARNGEEALRAASGCDLVLLDLMLPGISGWDVCRAIRGESAVPILMLTARGEEMDRVLGLELGADDYIVKPFSFRELLARVRANLRRVALSAPKERAATLGDVVIDPARRLVTRGGKPVALSFREFEVLAALLRANGAVVPRDELLDAVWGEGWIGGPRTLDVHVRWLREKLETDPGRPRLLLTARGVGYRLAREDELVPS